MVDTSASIKENVINLFLKPNAYLFEEPMNLIKQEMNEPANYNAIIEAIARGSTKLGEISTKTKQETSNVSAYLKALITLGLVEKESAVTEKENRKKPATASLTKCSVSGIVTFPNASSSFNPAKRNGHMIRLLRQIS